MAAPPNLTHIVFNPDNSVTITATNLANPVLDHGYFNASGIVGPPAVLAGGVQTNADNATHAYLMLAIPIKDIKDMGDTAEKQLKVNALERLHVSFFGKINNYFQDLNNNNEFDGIVELIKTHANKSFKYDITKSAYSSGKRLFGVSDVKDQNFEHNHEVTQYMDELTKLDYKVMNLTDINLLDTTINKAIGYANGTDNGDGTPTATLDALGQPVPIKKRMQPNQYTLLTDLKEILPLMTQILQPQHPPDAETKFMEKLSLKFQRYIEMKNRLLTFLGVNKNPKKGGSIKKQRRIKSGIPKYRSKKQRKPTRK